VSQVGRAIAVDLLRRHAEVGLERHIDPDVVEAACLAHDLGHPPFGHNTERELDALLWNDNHPDESLIDGYEGNAQSFRVVTKIAIKYHADERTPGLNLTAATLNALLKYPVTQDDPGQRRAKWGYYQSEREDFAFARSALSGSPTDTPCLEAEIMNIADDITYAVHDVEDFFRAGLLPLDTVASNSAERDWFLDCSELDGTRTRAFLDKLVLLRFQGRHANYAQLAEFRSSTVNRFIRGIDVALTDRGPTLRVAGHIAFEIAVLKDLTRVYVIESPAVQSQRYGQRRIIRTLFETFLEEATRPAKTARERSRYLQIFPPLYHELIQQLDIADIRSIKRTIADLIASMAEQQAIDTFAKLTGQSQGSVTEPIV
jgi:dGTPase